MVHTTNHVLTAFVTNIHTRGLKRIESQMLKGIPTHCSHCVFGKPKRWSAHRLPPSNVDTVNDNDFCIYAIILHLIGMVLLDGKVICFSKHQVTD